MDETNQTRRLTIIAGGVILSIMIFIFIASRLGHRFVLTATNPTTQKITTWTPSLTVSFSQKLSSQGLSISATPGLLYQKPTVQGSNLILYLSVPMQGKHTYNITIKSIEDTKKQRLVNKVFSFTPQEISSNNLPEDQKEQLLVRNEQSAIYKDPILKFLPYDNLYFSLTPSFGTADRNNLPVLTIDASITLNESQKADEADALASQKQQVTQLIRSWGLDPDKYTINYTVAGS